MILGGIAAILKITHLVPGLLHVSLTVFFIIIFGAVLLKTFFQRSAEERDPLLQSRIPRGVLFLAMGLLAIAVMFKIMHWPGHFYMFLIDAALQLAALVLSFVYPPDQIGRPDNPEILDS